MARPRKTKVEVIRFRADCDGVARRFDSRRAANVLIDAPSRSAARAI